MTFYRVIQTSIWDDPEFMDASPVCKLVFLHLLTNPFTSAFGCYRAGIAALAESSCLDPEAFREAFQEGLAKGWFKYDETFRVIFLPKFFKHNKPASMNVIAGWRKGIEMLPETPLKYECVLAMGQFAGTWGKNGEWQKHWEKSFSDFIEIALKMKDSEKPSQSLPESHMGARPRKENREQGTENREKDLKNTSYSSCPEPNASPSDAGPEAENVDGVSDDMFIRFPTCRKNEVYDLPKAQVADWQEIYSAVNVGQEILKAYSWIDSNPQKRKTKRGMKSFLNSWLSRAQDRGGSPPPGGGHPPPAKRKGASTSFEDRVQNSDYGNTEGWE